MLKPLSIVSLLLFATSTTASAQLVDVDQPAGSVAMALFSQTDLAQSFTPTKTNCAGGSVHFAPGLGVGGTFTMELWSELPNVTGASLLASGSGTATPDTWVDVFWPGVPVTPGTTYYMVYKNTDLGMALYGDLADPYAGGHLFANAGFTPFPTFDFAFRTWADGTPLGLTITGSCPTSVTIDIVGATPNGSIALAYGGNRSTFTLPPGVCGGLVIDMNNPVLAGFFTADATGALSLTTPIPARICGKTLQAVDITACETTNTVIL